MRATLVTVGVLFFLAAAAHAQEYYGVPIEDGGVAFLLDTSGSMENHGEELKAAADGLLRGLAGMIQGTSAGQSKLGQSIISRAAQTTKTQHVTKMVTARQELMRALDSLGRGTNFTIITFGDHAAEWPGGVRAAGPTSTSLAREYLATVSGAGSTPLAEALQLGFASSDVRTLFVVSDGRPNTTDVLQVVQRLQRSREGRRMIINTVGIGSDQDGGLLCQLALDNEGVYVRDGAIACTFSPCAEGDGIVTFYPPSEVHKTRSTTPICSSAEHADCTPRLVYETMLSHARFQVPGGGATPLTNCLNVDDPKPVTVVLEQDGLEATSYTRPGHPSHPGKTTRIVRQDGDSVVVETTSAGNLPRGGFEAIDRDLRDAVQARLGGRDEPPTPEPAPAPDPDVLVLPEKKPPR